ncbi:MAG: LysM peptidoglycan-binding domain-containing M23 family metallopeptidase [Holosporales bacterium]|jgi:murein DD-endopeptidase MepM/ murein hydrolase activator NlpD|nr:LysM peptidoglycan-binding domain-containing M23 family metallopeptidase [Holosporales bacterium]
MLYEPSTTETLSYTAKAGDTLSTIASKFGTTPQIVAEINQLEPPYVIAEGQILRCPKERTQEERAFASSGNISGQQETGWQSGVQVVPLTPSKKDDALGKTLSDRLKEARLEGDVEKGNTEATVKKNSLKAETKKHTDAEPEVLAPSRPAPKTKKEIPKSVSGSVSSKSAAHGSLVWPIQGEVLSSFGQGDSADGINITGQEGAKVLAADDGLVVYAGAKLKSFGNLVLMKHENGLMTAYAHLSKITVSKGDYIDRGQVLGTVGRTGAVSQAQVYFEVRKNKKPVDPMIYLSKSD